MPSSEREKKAPESVETAAVPGIEERLAGFGFQFPKESLKAQGFIIPDLSGNPISLEQQHGKIVLLNLWATWCPPCKAEMPSMEILYSEYKDMGLTILAVSSTRTNDSFDKVKDFIDSRGFTFPVLFDDRDQVPLSYHTGSIPVTYLIGKDGMIIARVVGSIDWADPGMKKIIEELLD